MAPRTRRQQPPQSQAAGAAGGPVPAMDVPQPDWPVFQQALEGAHQNLNTIGTELGKIPNMFERWDANFNAIMIGIAEINTALNNLTASLSLTEARKWNASQSHSVVSAVIPGRASPLGFPATKAEFFALAAPVVDAYLEYYSLAMNGDLAAKRQRLGSYLHILEE